MKTYHLKITKIAIICFISAILHGYAQQGSVTINQDKKIETLLDLKKDMNKNENALDRYKIQIYSGNRATAEKTQTDFKTKFADLPTTIVFETPNYKVWAGNFRTQLEADKALKDIRQKFPAAFKFQPKK